jgi:hypothetical protein
VARFHSEQQGLLVLAYFRQRSYDTIEVYQGDAGFFNENGRKGQVPAS